MYTLFVYSLLGFLLILPLYVLSLEHDRLDGIFGTTGEKVGEIMGIISGWGFFIFWMGLWISPQPRISSIFTWNSFYIIPLIGIETTSLQILLSMPLIVVGSWLGISGVKEMGLRVAETHKPAKIVTTGVYSWVRHPQYLAGLLGHVGITLLLGSLYSLYSIPLVFGFVYYLCRKEEHELLKEFGEDYCSYMKNVPMILPFPKLKFL